jgi:hypothetical protein
LDPILSPVPAVRLVIKLNLNKSRGEQEFGPQRNKRIFQIILNISLILGVYGFPNMA